jgi:hypothetical protein
MFDDHENYKFWKWLKPFMVTDFYLFDEQVSAIDDPHQIFNGDAIYAEWSTKTDDD